LSPEEAKIEEHAAYAEQIAGVLALADRDGEIEALKRHLIFSIGVSVGLLIALHLLLRRDG
jgi:hypothetical protein